MLSTLNNSQNLDPDYLDASFQVQQECQQTFTPFTLFYRLPALPCAGVY